ncbi:hypothetical protein OG393_30760 [Streptomyces sp. NBC_01216]|uniref:hypothetical protein n=1 Tax=Streptomyces sp. NBC_01216 TaxID=2903778 RepID=UPI002E0EF926|nr:hypothetical protein OG393_30760 [Streptomyces sp. NBC_01216]
MTHPPTDLPCPASAELLALAAKARPDWDPHALRDTLAQARHHGMTWSQVLAVTGRLLADPRATPADLISEAPEPWRQRRTAPIPETAHRGAAAVRAALHPDTNPTS